MNLDQIKAASLEVGLEILGAFHPPKEHQGCATIFLLGPAEPGFWKRIKESPEFQAPDPVDHWSERVIGKLADDHGATAFFPFGKPPYQPFVSWALTCGKVWQSPVNLMIHQSTGLFLSFRGALGFTEKLDIPKANDVSPCESCADKPCLTACPADALTAECYNIPTCHAWLDTDQGKPCMDGGCIARRACPVSKGYGRLKEQSAHHMRHFHKGY